LKKNGEKNIRGWRELDREGGNKRHDNNSDAIAKQFKMKVSIVTVVIIEYVGKKE
jgi:hypothetical protein